MTISLSFCLYVAAAIFSVGVFGFLTRRNTLVVMMSLQLMLNGVGLALVSLGRALLPDRLADPSGPYAFALVVLALTAAQSAVGLSIFLAVFRRSRSAQVGIVDSREG